MSGVFFSLKKKSLFFGVFHCHHYSFFVFLGFFLLFLTENLTFRFVKGKVCERESGGGGKGTEKKAKMNLGNNPFQFIS